MGQMGSVAGVPKKVCTKFVSLEELETKRRAVMQIK